MAREKPPEEPGDDIPAWFMTYSDVITLLMTFFILLLTFATTEPERFEKSISTMFASGSATGIAGEKMKQIDRDSFVNRLRVPASRIAMRGASMPPITHEPADETFGKGLRMLNDEEQKENELTSHYFDIPLSTLFEREGGLSEAGITTLRQLSHQLREMPFRANICYVDRDIAIPVAEILHYMFHIEKTRPGQVGMSLIQARDLPPRRIRVVIERFSQNEMSYSFASEQ